MLHKLIDQYYHQQQLVAGVVQQNTAVTPAVQLGLVLGNGTAKCLRPLAPLWIPWCLLAQNHQPHWVCARVLAAAVY
jgi:hypothetical protein